MPQYQITHDGDLHYPPARIAHPGDVVNDLPPGSVRWLLKEGLIALASDAPKDDSPGPQPDDTPIPEPEAPPLAPEPEPQGAEPEQGLEAPPVPAEEIPASEPETMEAGPEPEPAPEGPPPESEAP